MNQPSISIVVPVYNVGPYVEDCIRSVMRQTYTGPMECIIVDDCGTDDSMEIVERLVAEYDGPIAFQILHHTHNRGISAARNTGMDAVTGDYLFYIDSDDELTDDCIERLTEPLKKAWYDVVAGNVACYRFSPSGQLEKMRSAQELSVAEDCLLSPPQILRSHRKVWGQASWNKLYNVAFLRGNAIRFKEGILHEDNLWSFQVACLADGLYCVNHITYIYVNQRTGGITYHETKQEIANCMTTILMEMRAFVDSRKIDNRETFPFFRDFFYKVLDYDPGSLAAYVSRYRLLRPYINVSMTDIVKSNQHKIKDCLRDCLYLFPPRVAPYWLYLIRHL